MKPEKFKEIWTSSGESFSPLHPDRINNLKLSVATIEFLTIAGLPEDAAPFLSFIKDTDDKYDGISRLTDQYDFLGIEFNKFIVIGSDGSGNPIVIDTDNEDQIMELDHEDNFSGRYMNASIEDLADFLIFYREFVITVINENGEDAILNSNFSDNHVDLLKENMMDADPKALTDNSFWNEELELLRINREYYLNNE